VNFAIRPVPSQSTVATAGPSHEVTVASGRYRCTPTWHITKMTKSSDCRAVSETDRTRG